MLQNNHNQMKTVVETFIIEETAELIYDNEKLDQWNELVSELGLEGQTKIRKKEKSPIPFLCMNTVLVKTFETLCQRKVDITKYNATPIPVEILDLVALSKKEDYFDDIEIWYDEKDPDPACIGICYTNWIVSYEDKNRSQITDLTKAKATILAAETGGKISNYSWYKNEYLIGKWADVKRSFEELKKMAANRYFIEHSNKLNSEIIEAKQKLEMLKHDTYRMFGNDNVSTEFDLPF